MTWRDEFTFRFAKILANLPAREAIPDRDMHYALLIQNKFRSVCCMGAVIAFNTILFRKFALPQFGILVTGFWRRTAVDFFPALLYMNQQLGYQLFEITELLDYLESQGDPLGVRLADPRDTQKIQKEMQLKAKYLMDSQYWH
jgi:hypothetical protein